MITTSNTAIIAIKQNTNYHVNHVTNVSNLCMVSGRRDKGRVSVTVMVGETIFITII